MAKVNILICGTPGTGKSSLIDMVKPKLGEFNFVNISKFAIDNNCIEEYDEALSTQVMDEDKLNESLEPVVRENRFNLVESIHPDVLSPSLFDWVFVCRTDNTKLHDRLSSRGYSESKLKNNVEAEIFQLILDEARDAFKDSVLTQLVNDEPADLDKNAKIILDRIEILRKAKDK